MVCYVPSSKDDWSRRFSAPEFISHYNMSLLITSFEMLWLDSFNIYRPCHVTRGSGSYVIQNNADWKDWTARMMSRLTADWIGWKLQLQHHARGGDVGPRVQRREQWGQIWSAGAVNEDPPRDCSQNEPEIQRPCVVRNIMSCLKGIRARESNAKMVWFVGQANQLRGKKVPELKTIF